MAPKLTRHFTYLSVGVAIFIVLLGLAGCRMAPFDMAASIRAIEGDNGDSTPAGPFLLTFNGNTHDGGDPPASMPYMAGESISIPGQNTLFKNLHTFLGWNTASDGSGTDYPVGIATMPAANVVLHAQWTAAPTYTVTYNANGADAGIPPDDSNNYLDGAGAIVLDNTAGLTKAGYVFDGWNTQADGLGTDYAPTSLLTIAGANETLYAKWVALPTYTITYYANGATGAVPIDAGSYYAGQAITIAGQGALTSGTDSFAGWNTEAGGGGTAYAPGPNTMPAGDLDLYAQWSAVPTYTVTFDSNGGSAVAPEIVPDGGLVTEPGDPVRAGQLFAGWYSDAGLTTPWVFATNTVTADMVLYADWTPINYEITFNENGGAGTTASQFIFFGDSITLNANAFTRANHRFMGWAETDIGPVTLLDGALYTHTIETNRTFYAVWEQEYTVTYTALDADLGGTAPVDANVYIAGEIVTVLGNTGGLARTNHTFGGWTDGTDNYVAGNDFPMASINVVLDPIWVPNATYTVTYHGNGHTSGTPPLDVTAYPAGATVTPQARGSLERSQDGISLRFTGWNQIGGGGGAQQPGVDFTMPAENITLEAIWEVIGGVGPGGGLVFHDKGFVTNGWRYLEAAAVDQSAGTNWGPDDTTGATYGDYGDGALNTALIVPTFGPGTYAAAIANDYTGNGFTDWYLPSQAETYRMYQMLHLVGLGGFAANWYWSSGEGLNVARRVNFLDGAINTAPRTNSYRVRAARAFQGTAPTYVVAYVGNGADSGDPPVDPYHYAPGEAVTVLGHGTLALTGHSLAGWNTAADGTGVEYPVGSSPTMPSANLLLYARWSPAITAGDGTSLNPYQISTPEGLDAIRGDLAAHYMLVSDIDLGVAPWNSGAGWAPITNFSGTFDGNSKTIHNLFIDRTSGVGLFDLTQGATIQNVALANVNINASSGWAGALAGRTDSIGGGTTIVNVYATGTINGGQQLGGLVGLGQSVTISESFAEVSVVSASNMVGGLVGRLTGGTIDNSYALGAVSGLDIVGGLVGENTATISYSYAAGAVSGGSDLGGLVGTNTGMVTDSYYDIDTTGQSAGAGLGHTHVQMINSANFPAWDFFGIWDMVDGISYPFLRSQPPGTGARPL